jgi:RHS repeat-associated protein
MSMTQLTDTLTINGKAFTNAFNASAKQWTQTTPEGRRIVGTVNRVSQPERIEIEGLEDLQMTYDSMGRMTETAFGERQTTLGYDAASGYLTGVTNALKQETRFERDELGRPKKTVLPDQSEIQYAYDSAGNLISLSGPGATAAHRMDYTRTHLLEFYTSPSGATEAFQYDRDKRPVKRTYPSGRSIQWDYSGPNLLTAMRTPEGEHSYVYNPDTRQPERTLSRDGQRIDFGYDGDLLVQADWIGPVTGSVTCEYNSDRRVSNLRYAGLSLPIRYDNDGHVTGVGSIDIARDPSNGKQTSVTDGPFQMGYLYSPYGEIASATASYNGAILYECHYQYDALGRIAGKTECIEDVTHEWTYLYDARGQLTGVSRDGSPVETYSYSLAGNRIGAVNTLTSQNLSESDYEYDADGRLLRAGGTMYTFDADGRLNQVTLSGAPIGYVYNTDGTLAGVDLPTGGRVEYLYDSAGRRIARSLNGVRTHAWLYGQGAAPLAEYDGQGQLRSLFVYASGPAPVRMIRNGETFHLVSDLLGSPRLVVNASGTLVKRIDYDAFGNIIQDTNLAFDLPVGFAAGLADPAQELIRFGARDYQPSTGRWTARDPILAAGGWNLYAYAENSPVSRVDRSGLEDHPACPAQMSEKEEQWYFDHVISQFQGNQADKEYIADIYAAKYLAKAGYHVRGIEGFLITVDKFETALEEDRKKGNKIREAASTHPPTKERLEKVRKYAAEIERFRKELPEYYQKTIHRRINKDVYRQETKDME